MQVIGRQKRVVQIETFLHDGQLLSAGLFVAKDQKVLPGRATGKVLP